MVQNQNEYNYSDYSNSHNNREYEDRRRLLIQEQETLSAYEKTVAYNTFYSVIKWLEKYIEVAYSDDNDCWEWEKIDWKNRKRFRGEEGIKRADVNSIGRVEEQLSSALYMLADNYPFHFREDWKKEFYKWIDSMGISRDNCCRSKLNYYLFGVNEILEGRSEKIIEEAENRKDIFDISSSDYAEALNKAFASIQSPLQNQRELEQTLAGKTDRDIEIESKFDNGDIEKGENEFYFISQDIPLHDYQSNFHFFPQKENQQSFEVRVKRTVSEKIKRNLHEWNIREVVVFKGHCYDERDAVKEQALVHRSANLRKYDQKGCLKVDQRMIYFKKEISLEEWNEIERLKKQPRSMNSDFAKDWRIEKVVVWKTLWPFEKSIKEEKMLIHRSILSKDFKYNGVGKLKIDQEKMLLKSDFSEERWIEIEKELNRTQKNTEESMKGLEFSNSSKVNESSTNQGIRKSIIDDIKQNCKGWKVPVFNGKKEVKEVWFVNKSVKIGRDRNDKYNNYFFDPKTMYKLKDLTEAEQKQVGYNASEQTLPTSPITENNDKSIGTAGILTIIGSVSILVIAGVVALKKKLKKKSSK